MRKRDPARLDALIKAATSLLASEGYDRTRIHQVAERAGIGPGTVYLYVKDKDALFDLAVFRALGSPLVAHPALPFVGIQGRTAPTKLRAALEAIVHFPQLWLALSRRDVSVALEEYVGLLTEIAEWTVRYADAIRLATANRTDRPELDSLFGQVVWRELERGLVAYLATRIHTGLLRSASDPTTVARVTLDSLVASLATGRSQIRAGSDGGASLAAAVQLLTAGLRP